MIGPAPLDAIAALVVGLAYTVGVSARYSAGHWRLDAMYFAVLGTWSTMRLWPTFRVEVRPWLFAGTMSGFVLGGLERFLIGVAFHAVRCCRDEHEEYHDRLRQRCLHRTYRHSDAAHEILSYSLIFLALHLLLDRSRALDDILTLRVWHGLLLEHWIGDMLRACVQFQPREQHGRTVMCGGSPWRRFLDNASAYYWWHIMVHPLQCSGFSSPLWDSLTSRHPTGTRAWAPLPFVSFWTTDYARILGPHLDTAWRRYARDPRAFKHEMVVMHDR